jgi:hypothetical protein
MSDNVKKTCQDLIQSKYEETASYMETIIDAIANDEEIEGEDANTVFWDLPLEITSSRVIKILFSTGGPADWINVFVDSDNYIQYIEYHYQDWFDHASMKVSKNSYIYEYAQRVVDSLIETSEIN